MTLASLIGVLSAAAGLTTIIVIYHGYAAGAEAVTQALAALAADSFDGDGEAAKTFAGTVVRVGPAAIAGSVTLMLSVNLYAAARSVQLSHRLAETVARPADLALAARAAGDRARSSRPRRPGPCPRRRRNTPASSPAGSARPSPSRASPSRTPCRAASSSGR